MYRIICLLCFCLCFSCQEEITPDPPETPGNLYFPPKDGDTWEKTSPEDLNWDTSEIPALLDVLENNHTRAFLLVKDGKIVLEEYFGTKLTGNEDFDQNSNWYWASAGKTLTSFTVGLAQQEGLLDISEKSSTYLGLGWTSLSPEQENRITVRHQLTMTSGLNDTGPNPDNTESRSLTYFADAGNRWAYHNAPYTLLDQVVESAVGEDFDDFFKKKLRDKIGMDGFWSWLGDNHVYFSTPRSMARFGLLMLNEGKWESETILEDPTYMQDMIRPSQTLNESYGYLWWLNGQPSFMLPQSQVIFSGSIHPSAPADMYSGIGKNGQYVSIIPSQNLVLVRMGDNPQEALVPLLFQEDIWKQLNKIIP